MKDLSTKFINERHQLENQIRQCTSKIGEYQHENSVLRADNEKLATDIFNRQNEINAWKERLASLEKQQQSRIEQLTLEYEAKKKYEIEMALHDRESRFVGDKSNLETTNKLLKQKNIEYENKMTGLFQEITRLSKLNEDRINEIESWKVKYLEFEKNVNFHLEDIRNKWEEEKRQDMEAFAKQVSSKFIEERSIIDNQILAVKSKLTEAENKLTAVVVENEKLRFQLATINHDLDTWKGKYSQLEKQKTSDFELIRQNMEQEKRSHVERELKAQQSKVAVENGNNEIKLKESRTKIVELEQRNQFLMAELDRITRLLDERMKELELCKQQYSHLDHDKYAEMEEVRIQLDGIRRSTVGNHEYQVRFAAERAAYETQIMQLRQKLAEYELRINDYAKDNQRLNQLYFEKQKEAEAARDRVTSSSDVDGLKKELEYYKSRSFVRNH